MRAGRRPGRVRQRPPHPVPRDARLRGERAGAARRVPRPLRGASSGCNRWRGRRIAYRLAAALPEGLAHSRRGFLAGAGGLAAAALLTGPDAFAAQPRKRPSLRGGSFAEGVAVGRSRRRTAITLWTRLTDVEGTRHRRARGGARPRLPQVVARGLVRTSPGVGLLRQVAGRRTCSPHEQYCYRFTTRGSESPVGRFRTALPPDSRQPVRFAFFSCQDYTFGLLQRPPAARRRGHRLRGQPRRLHLRRGLLRARRRRSAGVRTDPIGFSETLEQYRAKYALYRTDPRAAADALALPDDLDLGRPRGAGQLRRRRRPDRRPVARAALHAGAPGRRLPGLLREHADVRRARARAATASTARCASGGRSTWSCSTSASTAPTSPAATRRSDRRATTSTQPRTFLGRRQMNFVKKRLAELAGGLEGDRQPGDGDADDLPGRRLHRLRLLAGLPARAARAAAAHPPQEDRGRGLRDRRHPHFRRGRRARGQRRQAAGGHRVRGRLDHLAGARRGRRRDPAGCGPVQPADARVDHRPADATPTPGPWTPTSTTTATGSSRPRQKSFSCSCGAWTRSSAVAQGAAGQALLLPHRARRTVPAGLQPGAPPPDRAAAVRPRSSGWPAPRRRRPPRRLASPPRAARSRALAAASGCSTADGSASSSSSAARAASARSTSRSSSARPADGVLRRARRAARPLPSGLAAARRSCLAAERAPGVGLAPLLAHARVLGPAALVAAQPALLERHRPRCPPRRAAHDRGRRAAARPRTPAAHPRAPRARRGRGGWSARRGSGRWPRTPPGSPATAAAARRPRGPSSGFSASSPENRNRPSSARALPGRQAGGALRRPRARCRSSRAPGCAGRGSRA